MSSKKLSKLFDSVSFYYPKEAEDYSVIAKLINSHSGTVVNVPSTANYYLVPHEWATKFSEDDDHKYYDVSIVTDWIVLGKIQFPNDYVVNKQFPVAQAIRDKLKAARKKARSESSNAVTAIVPVSEPLSPHRLVKVPLSPPKEAERPVTPSAHWSESRGRTFFTNEDDFKIIQYIEEAHAEIARRAYEKEANPNIKYETKAYSANGQNLWRQAVDDKLIPGKSWQAMEGRYKKYLRGNWATIQPAYTAWQNSKASSPSKPIAKKKR